MNDDSNFSFLFAGICLAIAIISSGTVLVKIVRPDVIKLGLAETASIQQSITAVIISALSVIAIAIARKLKMYNSHYSTLPKHAKIISDAEKKLDKVFALNLNEYMNDTTISEIRPIVNHYKKSPISDLKSQSIACAQCIDKLNKSVKKSRKTTSNSKVQELDASSTLRHSIVMLRVSMNKNKIKA